MFLLHVILFHLDSQAPTTAESSLGSWCAVKNGIAVVWKEGIVELEDMCEGEGRLEEARGKNAFPRSAFWGDRSTTVCGPSDSAGSLLRWAVGID